MSDERARKVNPMTYELEIQHPDESGLPGRAREILAETIGWDAVRRLFPRES